MINEFLSLYTLFMRSVTVILHYSILLMSSIVHSWIGGKRAGPLLISFHLVPPTLSPATGVTLLSLAHSALFFIVQNCVVSFHPLLWLLEEQDPSCKSAPTCTISDFFWVTFSKVSEPGLHWGFLDHVSWMSSLTLFFVLGLALAPWPLWAELLDHDYMINSFSLKLILIAWFLHLRSICFSFWLSEDSNPFFLGLLNFHQLQ